MFKLVAHIELSPEKEADFFDAFIGLVENFGGETAAFFKYENEEEEDGQKAS